MIPKGHFYYMRGFEHEDRIRIHAHVKRALPILWNRGGDYVLIQKTTVENAINTLSCISKMSNERLHPQVCIYWNQGIPVTNQVGRILAGEE